MSTPPPKIGRCQLCSQPRPLFPYLYGLPESGHTDTAQLCARCYSRSAVRNDPRQLAEDLFYAIGAHS